MTRQLKLPRYKLPRYKLPRYKLPRYKLPRYLVILDGSTRVSARANHVVGEPSFDTAVSGECRS
jgi:hypothetical protein